MFQFPAFAPFRRVARSLVLGCPIRKSPDQWLFAPPRSLSQLITSFFASESQGIPHALLVTFSNFSYSYFFFLSLEIPANAGISRVKLDSSSMSMNSLFLSEIGGSRESESSKTYIRTRMNQQIPKRLRIAVCDETSPERRYSSHTFRYGYLVTT